MEFSLKNGNWINRPQRFVLEDDYGAISTEPHTDFWQRTYYGFQNINAPAILFDATQSFTFTIKTSFEYRKRFDQCGLFVYIDDENWAKASIEYENDHLSLLGSVVTNLGYSDWATRDIEHSNSIFYRLSQRGPDFLIESSGDGEDFQQMRVFHLHQLGKTTREMGRKTSPEGKSIRFGLYACSPMDSSFTAQFEQPKLEKCIWQAHGD